MNEEGEEKREENEGDEVEGRDVVGTLRLAMQEIVAIVGEESVVKGNKGKVGNAVGQVESSREQADAVVVEEEEEEEEEEDEEVVVEEKDGGEERRIESLFLDSCFGITRILFFTDLVGTTNVSLLLSKKRHSFLP